MGVSMHLCDIRQTRSVYLHYKAHKIGSIWTWIVILFGVRITCLIWIKWLRMCGFTQAYETQAERKPEKEKSRLCCCTTVGKSIHDHNTDRKTQSEAKGWRYSLNTYIHTFILRATVKPCCLHWLCFFLCSHLDLIKLYITDGSTFSFHQEWRSLEHTDTDSPPERRSVRQRLTATRVPGCINHPGLACERKSPSSELLHAISVYVQLV